MNVLPPIGTNHLLWKFVQGVDLYSEGIIYGDNSQLWLLTDTSMTRTPHLNRQDSL